MKLQHAILTTALVMATPLSHAEGVSGLHASVVGEFHESYNEEVAVSGNIIAGIMLSALPSTQTFTPHILIRPDDNGGSNNICLSVVSQDGVYQSHNTYQLPNIQQATFIPLDYTSSRYQDYLRGDAGTHLAIKAQDGPCGNESSEQYLLTTLAAPEVNTRNLALRIDSLGATEVMTAARTADRTVHKGHCEAISGERKTGYDFTCTIALPDVTSGEVDIQLQRRRFGRMMQSLRFKVEL